MNASVTYAVSFATRSTLWTWQASVSLFSLLTRRSNQANQPWVTLVDEDKDASVCNEKPPKKENKAVTSTATIQSDCIEMSHIPAKITKEQFE